MAAEGSNSTPRDEVIHLGSCVGRKAMDAGRMISELVYFCAIFKNALYQGTTLVVP
jgi:hypothetical protein